MCVKQGGQSLWLGQKNKPQTHPRKRNHPRKFPDDPSEEPKPASGRHRGAFPAAFLKKPGQACTLSMLANMSLEQGPVTR